MPKSLAVLSEKIADFIVRVEFDRQSLSSKECRLSKLFEEKNHEINEYIRTVESEITHFKDIMTRAGAAQWHRESESLLKETKSNIKTLEGVYKTTCDAIKVECEHLNHGAMGLLKNTSQNLFQIKQQDLAKITEQKTLALQKDCDVNYQNIQKMLYQFRWKNFGWALVISLIVAMIVSLYIMDEWPWQAHLEVVKQRQAGEILLSSWKQLSDADKLLIQQSA